MVLSEENKKEIKDVILELEHDSQLFRPDEVVDAAKRKGISEKETHTLLTELKREGYIHEVHGTEGLLSRTIWKDYSPAFEKMPDF
ncbi:MAG: hypothetical protein R6U26_03025 [Candidatus Undinarchaeales archaeon]